MSPENIGESSMPDPVLPDPLLQPGTFIDPTPTPNGNRTPNSNPNSNSKSKPHSERKAGSVDVTDAANRPGWLPADWIFKETLRTSGASAGTRDKYFIEPVANRRFRSKKEVLLFLETGTTPKPKRKGADTNNKAQGNSEASKSEPPANSKTPKRRKSEAKAKVPVKTFNWDDVPEKVKWSLGDVYEGTWRPLINGVDRVPESSKQEWGEAFAYLTMQAGGRGVF